MAHQPGWATARHTANLAAWVASQCDRGGTSGRARYARCASASLASAGMRHLGIKTQALLEGEVFDTPVQYPSTFTGNGVSLAVDDWKRRRVTPTASLAGSLLDHLSHLSWRAVLMVSYGGMPMKSLSSTPLTARIAGHRRACRGAAALGFLLIGGVAPPKPRAPSLILSE